MLWPEWPRRAKTTHSSHFLEIGCHWHVDSQVPVEAPLLTDLFRARDWGKGRNDVKCQHLESVKRPICRQFSAKEAKGLILFLSAQKGRLLMHSVCVTSMVGDSSDLTQQEGN